MRAAIVTEEDTQRRYRGSNRIVRRIRRSVVLLLIIGSTREVSSLGRSQMSSDPFTASTSPPKRRNTSPPHIEQGSRLKSRLIKRDERRAVSEERATASKGRASSRERSAEGRGSSSFSSQHPQRPLSPLEETIFAPDGHALHYDTAQGWTRDSPGEDEGRRDSDSSTITSASSENNPLRAFKYGDYAYSFGSRWVRRVVEIDISKSRSESRVYNCFDGVKDVLLEWLQKHRTRQRTSFTEKENGYADMPGELLKFGSCGSNIPRSVSRSETTSTARRPRPTPVDTGRERSRSPALPPRNRSPMSSSPKRPNRRYEIKTRASVVTCEDGVSGQCDNFCTSIMEGVHGEERRSMMVPCVQGRDGCTASVPREDTTSLTSTQCQSRRCETLYGRFSCSSIVLSDEMSDAARFARCKQFCHTVPQFSFQCTYDEETRRCRDDRSVTCKSCVVVETPPKHPRKRLDARGLTRTPQSGGGFLTGDGGGSAFDPVVPRGGDRADGTSP